MIQGSGEATRDKELQRPQQQTHTSGQPPEHSQVGHSSTSELIQQPIVISQVTAATVQAYSQRIALAQTVPTTVNVIATPLTTTGVGSASGTGNATYQHYLIPGVSLGGQVQNIAIPAQVAVSVQQGSLRTAGGTQAIVTTAAPTYTINPQQDLARILAATNQSFAVRPTHLCSSGITTSSEQVHTFDVPPGLSATVRNIQFQKVTGSGCTVLTNIPVTSTMTQRNVIGGVRPDNVAIHISSSPISSLSQQSQTALVLDTVTSPEFLHTDVTKVHSYSLASASPTASSCTGSVYQQVGGIASVPASLIQQKSLVTLPGHTSSSVSQNRTVGTSINVSSNISPSSTTGIVQSSVNSLNNSFNTSVVSSSTLNMPLASSDMSPLHSPKLKRIKLEEKPPADEETGSMRKRICDYRNNEIKNNKEKYQEHLAELFFLQSGGNIMDYLSWRRRPVPQLLAFLKANALESDGEDETITDTKASASVPSMHITSVVPTSQAKQSGSTIEPASKSSLPNLNTTSSSHSTPSRPTVTSPLRSQPGTGIPTTPKLPKSSPSAALPANRLHTRQHYISAVYDSAIGSQEEIVERAKQEAYVMQRISELRKDGLWSAKRLPKVQEPPRAKAHWDYLLEEMVWLATDFAQERKWKKAAAKKCSRMILKYHQEREMKAERAEREEYLRLRKIASQVAKEIKQFWTNIEKLVEFKQQTRLEEKRKKALDLHLNFIVDQTEKYSSWLTQGMNKNTSEDTPASSLNEIATSVEGSETTLDDKDFEPDTSGTDDEETIEKEEAHGINEDEQSKEIEMLHQESELPIDELIKSLPSDILEKPASPLSVDQSNEEDLGDDQSEDETELRSNVLHLGGMVDVKDEEYYMSNEDEDDETTIQEQEKKETKEDYDDELKELQELGDMPLEELLERYAGAYTSDNDISVSEYSSSNEEQGSSDGDDECNNSMKMESARASDEDEDIEEEDEEEDEGEEFGTDDESEMLDVGMEFLINPEKAHHHSKTEEKIKDDKVKGPSQEITDIAAAAESFQPKGNTLSTTQVCTKIPFLLKHQLREYQHIGLDWLVTMHDRKLNGILADEMGLGKTIQTIALLAHLACEKGIWGPHLIVVPTSVMLNWEMEFKKWCPAFKIITYYGSQKERRKKREGWTKPNAFHVCITSYKLVIQDHYSFRRKKWKYFILDEAQHIKNFKSQRWQMLLNFQSSRRLLLTGTPLQNSLMELWSLMHFLMPNVFQSHREFREWFANPVTGMIEGSHEYSESLIKRLHKVLRPFLLRRLKCEVEKQLPKKYEHVIMCRLSKRQRYLYDEFMSQTKTRETLSTGNFMSVINILMQLRKVCNHPNLFESRPTVSPFMMQVITYSTASVAKKAFEYDPFKHVNLWALNLLIVDLELHLTAFAAHRIKKFQTSARFIEDINNQPELPPRCPPGKLRLHVKAPSQTNGSNTTSGSSPKPATIVRASAAPVINRSTNLVQPQVQTQHQRIVVVSGANSAPSSRAASPIAAVGPTNNQVGNQTSSTEYTLQLIQQPATGSISVAQLTPVSVGSQMVTTTPITVQIQQTGQGGTRLAMPLGIGRLVQTATGQHILLTPATSVANINSEAVVPRQLHQPATTIAGNVSASVVVQVPSITAPSVYTPTNKVNICTTQPALTNTVSSGLSRGFGSSISGISTTKPIVRVAPLNMSTVNSNLTGTTVYNTKSPTVHIANKPVTRSDNQLQSLQKMDCKKSDNRNSIFYIESLTEKRIQSHREKLKKIGYINTRRCAARPLYGDDLVKAVTVTNDIRPCPKSIPWKGMGYVHCYNAPFAYQNSSNYWFYTSVLASLIHTPETYLQELSDIITRYVFLVPDVTAPQITLHMSHPSPSALHEETLTAQLLHQELSPRCSLLHPITSNTRTQFPELRLIQYDCGKLQTLDKLLWQLKSEGHRALIFTQMTRMLDVFEQFLNHHGHTYLRLDGTTKVDQRQALMERFNADRRIFCFILSTRSGGIGVNLTGADTVIFYDSDWNPTMDAQAQDRCHRIGQTRDVHIYRLISERTVEENILKKANQKRLLGDLAIEGGNFTTAFFKQNTLRDLFGIDISVESETKKDNDSNLKSEFDTDEKSVDLEKLAQTQFEQALCMAEEDLDVQAAKTARAEAAAELAEFDESIPFDADSRDNEEKSQAEEELDKLMEQLSPVEKYAMQFLESLQEPFSLEQLKQAEEEIEAQKKDWELGRLKALKEEEERRAATLEDDEEPLLTYTREDAYSQVAKSRSVKGRGNKIVGRRSRGESSGSGSSTLSSKTPQRRSTRISNKQELRNVSEDDDGKAKVSKQPKKTINHVDMKLLSKSTLKVNCYPITSITSNGPTKSNDGDSKHKTTQYISSGASSKIKTPLNIPLPFSNPNLVIRTRRASAREAKAEKLKQESDVEIDVVAINTNELCFSHMGTNRHIPLKHSSPNSRISPDKYVKRSKISSSKNSQETLGEEQNGV